MEAQFLAVEDGFDLQFAGRTVLRHRSNSPVLALARGNSQVTMLRGNFEIADAPEGRVEPGQSAIVHNIAYLQHNGAEVAQLRIEANKLVVAANDPTIDRLWLRFHAEPDEAVWGGGEQMSYLNLAGRRFPLWTSEPGVGRDKTTELTQMMDLSGMAGGDYWTTNYPQPTILTSRWLAVHLDVSCFSAIDCTDPAALEFEVWQGNATFELFAAEGPAALVGQLFTRFGRQPPLPDWAIGGAIVGLKDGARSFDRLEPSPHCGVKIGPECAKPVSVAACSGTGGAITSASLTCPNGSPRWRRAGSASLLMPIHTSQTTASCMRRREKVATSACDRIRTRCTWSISASSIAG
jgi:alpha-glucosidase